ncbi:MAG: pyridoxal phosphate-dependent aminotransferase family protein, partial [Bacteroidetes bacterium]|nr:pyridoxal phosphate-dependent aminotransferase family protein [Bacteroidota bacterium]
MFAQNQLIDFCSNDYLGFASSSVFRNNILAEYKTLQEQKNGSTGSRLLAGNSEYVENLEKKIALFHNADVGLIYNSGYDANVGLFSAVLQKGDNIIYDELIHASI